MKLLVLLCNTNIAVSVLQVVLHVVLQVDDKYHHNDYTF